MTEVGGSSPSSAHLWKTNNKMHFSSTVKHRPKIRQCRNGVSTLPELRTTNGQARPRLGWRLQVVPPGLADKRETRANCLASSHVGGFAKQRTSRGFARGKPTKYPLHVLGACGSRGASRRQAMVSATRGKRPPPTYRL